MKNLFNKIKKPLKKIKNYKKKNIKTNPLIERKKNYFSQIKTIKTKNINNIY